MNTPCTDWNRADAIEVLAEAWRHQYLPLQDLVERSNQVQYANWTKDLDRLFEGIPKQFSWRYPRRFPKTPQNRRTK